MRRRWNRRKNATYSAVLVAVVGLAWVCARLVVRERPEASGSAVAVREHASDAVRKSGQTAAPASEAPSPAATRKSGGAASAVTDATGPAAPSGSSTGASAAASSTSAAAAVSGGTSAGAASRAPVGGATLYGSVSLSDGRPAVGAKVTAIQTSKRQDGEPAPPGSGERPSEKKTAQADLPSAQVGADGRYEIEHLPPGHYLVTATDNTATDKRHRDETRYPQLREGGSERLDFVLKDAAKLAGHVRDPQGAPLAGMHVSSPWPKREVVTGEDGSFELSGFNPRVGHAYLTIEDPTGSFGTVRVQASTGEKDLVVVLRPAGHISVRVVDGRTEAGVEGALVVAVLASQDKGVLARLQRSQAPSAQTDARGQFEIGALAPGAYELQVAHPAYADQTATVRVAEGETRELTVRLDAGATVTGRAFDKQTGLGVPGAFVADVTDLPTVGPFGPAQAMELQVGAVMRQLGAAAWTAQAQERLEADFGKQNVSLTITGEDGSFRLEHLPEGARQLICVHRDHPAATRSVTLSAGQPIRVDFALGLGGSIEGTVRGPGGAPIAGVKVQALAPRGSRIAQTTDDGSYALRGLSPGTYMVMVLGLPKQETASAMQTMRTVSVKDGEVTRLDFGEAPTGAVLVGTIAVEGGLPEKKVVLWKADGGLANVLGTQVERVANDGSFRFEGVEAGSYELMIPPTYQRAVTVPAGQDEVRLDLRLPARQVTGVVLGPDGGPGKGAEVTAVRAADRDDPLLSRRRAETTADALGRFTLRPLDTVTYEVEVTLPGKGVTRQRVSLASADRTGLELRLDATGTIRAHVVDPNGHPVSDVVLIAVGADGRRYTTDQSPGLSKNPEPRLETVPAGTYTVWALSVAYAFDRQTGVRFDGTEITVELGLSPGGTLEVHGQDPAGAPVEGGALELRLAGGAALPSTFMGALFGSTRTGADGTVTRKRLKAGSYQGTVRTQDGREGAFTATIRDGETTRVAVTLAAP